jgi:hypothetical protein
MALYLPSSASLAAAHTLTTTVRTMRQILAIFPALLYSRPRLTNPAPRTAVKATIKALECMLLPSLAQSRSTDNKPPTSNLTNSACKQRWKDLAAYGFDRYWHCNKCHCLFRNDEGFFTVHIEACREWEKEHMRAKPHTNDVFPPHWEIAVEQFPLSTPKPGPNYVHDKSPRDVPLRNRASGERSSAGSACGITRDNVSLFRAESTPIF